jgi:hypothetical protein
MRLRLLLGTLGVAMGAFGLLRFLQHDFGDIVDSVLWLAGGVVVHDAIIAPLTIGAIVLGRRVLPRKFWVVTASGLVVLLTVTVTAVPVLGSFGTRPDNPTLLDRNYTVAWIVFALLVLLVSLLRLTPLWRRLGSRHPVARPTDKGGE